MIRLLALLAGMFLGVTSVGGTLERQFRRPPQEARPWCYWWWQNGNADKASITATRNVLTIAYRGWTCSYETDGEIVDTHRSACNRNGVYRRFEARGDTHVRVKVSIRKSGPGAGV